MCVDLPLSSNEKTMVDELMDVGVACFCSVDDLAFQDKRATEPHKHGFHHLMVCTSGTGIYAEGDQKFRINAPAVIFTPFDTFHHWPDWGSMEGYGLGISTELVYPDYHLNFFGDSSKRIVEINNDLLKNVIPFLDKIKREWELNKSEREMIYYSCLNILFSEIVDCCHVATEGEDCVKETLCRQFTQLLEKSWSYSHSPDFYAKKLNVTTDYLSKALRERYGKSSRSMIKTKIIKEARHLLASTTINVKAVSFRLGFNDPGYFSRFFRKMTGESPKSYRNKIMKS